MVTGSRMCLRLSSFPLFLLSSRVCLPACRVQGVEVVVVVGETLPGGAAGRQQPGPPQGWRAERGYHDTHILPN